eukprot:403364846
MQLHQKSISNQNPKTTKEQIIPSASAAIAVRSVFDLTSQHQSRETYKQGYEANQFNNKSSLDVLNKEQEQLHIKQNDWYNYGEQNQKYSLDQSNTNKTNYDSLMTEFSQGKHPYKQLINKDSYGSIVQAGTPSIRAAVSNRHEEKKELINTYQIIVRNNKFIPENLKIEKGSIVEWRIQEDLEEESDITYYKNSSATRSHVVAFNDIHTESNILRLNDTFKVKFHECGQFTYRCQIYTYMKGSIKVFENQNALLQHQRESLAFQRFQAAAPYDIRTASSKENDKRKSHQIQSQLSQRLIEVLEEEKHIETQEETPIVSKKFFKEVFDKYNHQLKCEAELTSESEMQPSASEDIDDQEEKNFLEQQRHSSKGSKESSNKQSGQPSHKSSGSEQLLIAQESVNNNQSQIDNELLVAQYDPSNLTQYSLLFHSTKADQESQDILNNALNRQELLNQSDVSKDQLSIDQNDIHEQDNQELEASQLPQNTVQNKKAMFIVRTLEPDRRGGQKQISKEFLIESSNLIQDDPLLGKQLDEIHRQQLQKQKMKAKRRQYLQKRKQKESNQKKPNQFDLCIMNQLKNRLNQRSNQSQKLFLQRSYEQETIQRMMNQIQLNFDQLQKDAVLL